MFSRNGTIKDQQAWYREQRDNANPIPGALALMAFALLIILLALGYSR